MESLAADLRTMARTPLHDAHVEAMREVGEVVTFEPGDMVIELGDPIDAFHYVLEGEVEAVDPVTGGRYGEGATVGAGQFMGEIGFLTGGKALLAMRVLQPSRVLAVPRDTMLTLMSQIPEMSDIVVTVLSARRRRLLESDQNSLTLIGMDRSREIRAIAAFAGRNRLPFRALDLGDLEAGEIARTCDLTPREPAVIFGRDTVIEHPTPRKIAELYGLDQRIGSDEVFDVLIVGGGPGGIAAGVYAGAEGLRALVIEDSTIGGQAGTSSRIENYMGFPTGISGGDLCWRGEVQALKFGTRFAVPRRAAALERRADGSFCVTLDDGNQTCARAIVAACGVQYRRLPLERLAAFEGNGIYYAATEIEARFCRNTDVVIVGGGNSAGQAAMFLSRHARCVHLLVRGEGLASSMSRYLSDRLESDPRIHVRTQTQIDELCGADHLDGVRLTGAGVSEGEDRIDTRAVFIMVGAAPNTEWLGDGVRTDDKGFVLTGEAVGRDSPFETSASGIFAIGDVRAGSVKRVASAVGEGSVVISRVWEHVMSQRDAEAGTKASDE